MSEIEELVFRQLGQQAELEPVERGFVWQRDDGVTSIRFRPTTVPPDQFGLCATAIIETTFHENVPVADEEGIARLNRRACFGHFFRANDRLGVRASYCIYEKEPAATWVAIILLRAMGEQLALAYAIAHTEFVPKSLPANRANLEYPRRWELPPDATVFDESAKTFLERGLVSTRGHHGLVLEVPLADGASSRMIDGRAETALLHVSYDVPHPLAGVGYLATIALPYDPPRDTVPFWCDLLNAEEFGKQDFVPRLGAWGMRGAAGELVYSFFWPTTRADRGIDLNLMNWNVQRTLWIKARHWRPGTGLVWEASDGTR